MPSENVTTFESLLTVWTIRAALVCMVITLLMRLQMSPHPTGLSIAKGCWILGATCSLFHAVCAMGFHHQFNHELAFESTAEQTYDSLGVRVGIGIYFNYLFVILWIADAAWWLLATQHYLGRSRWAVALIYGFLTFIAFNGAVVFEAGWIRWLSLAATLLIVGMTFRRWSKTDSAKKKTTKP